MDFINQILYFVIIIGILVAIHEFGHFIAARLSGMRVDVFAIGMGKRLFGYNKITGFTWGALPDDWEGNGYTDYRLSLLPIGGYVKIAGMIDESFDTNYAQKEAQPWEFRSKNAWQKAFVITAGVIMNILLTYAIYSGMAYVNGETIYHTTAMSYVEKESPLFAAGLRPGDKVTSVDGKQVSTWQDLLKALTTKKVGDNKSLAVVQNGEQRTLTVSGKAIVDALSSQKSLGIYPEGSVVFITQILANSPAQKTSIQASDTLISIEGIPVVSTNQFMHVVSQNKDKALSLRWKHEGAVMSSVVTPNSDGKIGVGIQTAYTGTQSTIAYSFADALGEGFHDTQNATTAFFDMIGQIIKGAISAKQALGGPLRIAEMAAQSAELGFAYFISLMAGLSMTLAIINILPFPALDGGHLVFIIVEGVARREVPIKIKLAFQQVGIVLLLGFMAFVFYNDIMHKISN